MKNEVVSIRVRHLKVGDTIVYPDGQEEIVLLVRPSRTTNMHDIRTNLTHGRFTMRKTNGRINVRLR